MKEIIINLLPVILTILVALDAIIKHRIGTIRKREIEKEREAAKQPEFWDDNAI